MRFRQRIAPLPITAQEPGMKLPPAAPMEKRALRTVQRRCCELGERIGNAFEDGAAEIGYDGFANRKER